MAGKGNFLERLKAGEILCSDGAWATELQKMGLEPGGNPDELNLTKPELPRQIARNYCEAGADMILTNTFGSNGFRQRHYGLANKVKDLNIAGAKHSKEIAKEFGAFVVGSMGPSGEMVEPLGLVSNKEMYENFLEQALALKEGGVDAVVVETIFALEELRQAVRAAKDAGLFTMATMTFDPGAFGFKTMWGVSTEQAARGMDEAGADVIGTNCGNGIDNMVKIVKEMRPHTKKPILVHSNAGVATKIVNGLPFYEETPEQMAERVKDLAAAGAAIIGGCCGTTPEHVRRFRQEIDRLNQQRK